MFLQRLRLVITLIGFTGFCFIMIGGKSSNSTIKEWISEDILNSPDSLGTVLGCPQLIDSKYGKVVRFDGFKDAIFFNQMPLKDLRQFTIEVIFYPESEGSFEQRFFHCGEVNGPRVLLETRSNEKFWYFDAFIKSELSQKALIEEHYTHLLNHWYHVAFIVDNGSLKTFVNGEKELEAKIDMVPLQNGITSIGARQNKVSWFKGSIYKIRISSTVLSKDEFLQF